MASTGSTFVSMSSGLIRTVAVDTVLKTSTYGTATTIAVTEVWRYRTEGILLES